MTVQCCSCMKMLPQYFLIVNLLVFVEVVVNQLVHTDNNIIQLLPHEHDNCTPWHYYNQSDGKCYCYQSDYLTEMIKCTSETALLGFGYCITYEEEDEATFVSQCPFFQMQGHKVHDSESGFIELPKNISELNVYMCRPMNRRGFLCSECIDGFGLSFMSPGHTCSNCTNFLGIPLYILIELVPLTVFYFIILVFHINLTSSPMTCYIFFSQLFIAAMSMDGNPELSKLLSGGMGYKTAVFSVYGIWSLDTFFSVLPPFCVSSKLNTIHITLLGYVTVLYPLCLIIMTWISVELHDRNFRLLVWLWRPFHGCFVRLRRGWDTESDIIDVFCTFLLLSYTKLVYQSLLLINWQTALKANNSGYVTFIQFAKNDPHLTCGSSKYVLLAVSGGLILFLSLLPPLLLILYPMKCFRTCLSKCRLDKPVVTLFVDKFYSCYRDGLDGGRDMRSWSGFYFLLRFVPLTSSFLNRSLHITAWSASSLLYITIAVSIALVKPYKKGYMNILDTLLLSLTAMLCHLVTLKYSTATGIQIAVISSIPGIVFWSYLTFMLIITLWKNAKVIILSCTMSCFRKLEGEGNDCSQSLIQPPPAIVTIADVSSYGST